MFSSHRGIGGLSCLDLSLGHREGGEEKVVAYSLVCYDLLHLAGA